MATRGGIVRVLQEDPVRWHGRYHHWDSYPSGLGKVLWNLYHNHFNGDLQHMLVTLIDQHPAGWSTIVGKDFNLKPGYVEWNKRDKKSKIKNKPMCYCHGNRRESPHDLTEKNAAAIGVEWVYGFLTKNGRDRMNIYASVVRSKDGTVMKMIGMFGKGDEKAEWQLVASIPLDDPEPAWDAIDI